MPDKQVVEDIIARVGDLPAMPAVVSQVLRLTDDPTAEMADISAAIQSDPAMAAKILRISNSSYYGMRQYVGTLKLALVILGVREVRNIVLGISVYEAFADNRKDLAAAQEIWDSSLRLAGLSKRLGEYMGLGLQGEEFVAGLLADTGKMVLLRHLRGVYTEFLQRCGENMQGLCNEEMMEVGCTHADVAAALAIQWSLPQSLVDALWCQYPSPQRALKDAAEPRLAAVLRIAKLALHADFSQSEPVAALEDAEAWAALEEAKNCIPPKDRQAMLASYVEEMRTAPVLSL